MQMKGIKTKHYFSKIMTIYGQNSVRAALSNHSLDCRNMHVSVSKQNNAKIRNLIKLAEERDLYIKFYAEAELARISKNGRQDQGVALDVLCPNFQEVSTHASQLKDKSNLIAFDGITNPKNIGMIIRSTVAAGIDGIVYPQRNSPRLGPLVIQASAGTLFSAPILKCNSIEDAMHEYTKKDFQIFILDVKSKNTLLNMTFGERNMFILGGETLGTSPSVRRLANQTISIPMSNNVDSLNVAVAGSILSYFIRYTLKSS